MKNTILVYISKNKIDGRKYEVMFPKKGVAMANKATKELLKSSWQLNQSLIRCLKQIW